MSSEFEEYKIRFQKAWDELEHPWQKDMISIDNSDVRITPIVDSTIIEQPSSDQVPDGALSSGIVVPDTYILQWNWAMRPNPVCLAAWLEWFTRSLMTGSNEMVELFRYSEGQIVRLNPFLVIPSDDLPENSKDVILICRVPWEVDIKGDDYTGDLYVRARARFGVFQGMTDDARH